MWQAFIAMLVKLFVSEARDALARPDVAVNVAIESPELGGNLKKNLQVALPNFKNPFAVGLLILFFTLPGCRIFDAVEVVTFVPETVREDGTPYLIMMVGEGVEGTFYITKDGGATWIKAKGTPPAGWILVSPLVAQRGKIAFAPGPNVDSDSIPVP